AAHPGAVLAALARDLVPQFDREELAVALAVELADLRVAVGVRAVGAAEVAGIDDGEHHHHRELFGRAAQLFWICFQLISSASSGRWGRTRRSDRRADRARSRRRR